MDFAPPRRSWQGVLLPALFGCLVVGLFLMPTPFYRGNALSGSSSHGGDNEIDELLLLRGKHAQRSRSPGADEAATLNLLRYFSVAHEEGQLSATALKEIELLVRSQTHPYSPLPSSSSPSTSSSSLEKHHSTSTQTHTQSSPPLPPSLVLNSNSTNPYASVQEGIYWAGRGRREAQLDIIHHNYSAIRPFDKWGPIYIWDWFTPDYVCPTMERVGQVGDGGKWMCGLETLIQRPEKQERPCIVYAFGVNDETSFEEELVNRTRCQVFAFDPTVPDLPETATNVTPPITFFKQALGPKDGPSRVFLMERNLLSIMKELGHEYVDVLKVDVEGAEWNSFAAVFAGQDLKTLPVGQLLIELHYRDVPTTFDFFTHMEAAGFRIFSRETNYHPCVVGKMPVAIEYSFIHLDTYFTGLPTQASKQLLARLPAHKKENAAIYMLTQRGRIHNHLLTMLKGFDHYFNRGPGRGYPLILFHDDFTAEDEAIVRAATTSPITFHRVDFEIPAWLDKEKIPERTECSKHSSTVGYRHMCRFLGLQVQHLLSDYEWHWRLDDDSLFLAPVGYDPFRLMRENNKRYGFNRIMHDNVQCVVGLWDAAKAFATEHNLSPTFLDDWDSGVVFYNNFEISHRSIWQDPVVQSFMDYIDNLGGIYYVRWGDAPIRSLAVAMAVPETQVHFFSDVGYAHLPYHRHEPRPLPPPFTGALWHLDGAFQYMRDVEEDKKLQRMGGLAMRRQHGVITIFSNKERYDQLKRCLASLEKHFNKKRGYHIWVWTHGLTYAQRLELRALSSSPVRIDNMDRPLNLTFEKGAGAAKGPCGPRDLTSTRLLGWEVSRVIADRYEWQWRLADDAFFSEDLDEDPFLTMVQTKATYGMAAVRPVPPKQRACVRRLVDAATNMLALEKEGAAEVLDMVESVYFDPSFELSHRSVWEDPRWETLLEIVESDKGVGKEKKKKEDGPGFTYTHAPFLGNVDEAYIRSVGVALVMESGQGALHIFDKTLNVVDLSESLVPWVKEGEEEKVESKKGKKQVMVEGHAVEASHDSTIVSKLFRPQRLGFLEADLGVPVSLPTDLATPQAGAEANSRSRRNVGASVSSSSSLSSSAAAASPEIAWMLTKARIGHMNNTKPVPGFILEDAVALLSPKTQSADFFWRYAASDRMPTSIINDGTLGRDEALIPMAGLAVVPEQHPDELRLVLLCQRRNVSEFVLEGQRTQLGSAVVVVANAHMAPSRWVYEVRRIPGTGVWSGWHTAMALTDGQTISRTSASEAVYMLGEQTTNVTTSVSPEGLATWYLKREHVLAKVPLASLLRLSVDKMEIFAARDNGHWEPYLTVLQEGGQSTADERVRTHTQTLIPSTGIQALVSEQVGLGYLPGPQLWYVADVVPQASEEGKIMHLILKTAKIPTGPWQEHVVMRLPSEYATPQYICPSLYLLPDLVRDKDKEWELALGLGCKVNGHGARPVQEGHSQLSAQVGPTAVDVLRVKFQRGGEKVAEVEVPPV